MLKIIHTFFSLIIFTILVAGCDNNSQQENIKKVNQNINSIPQSIKNQLTHGVKYQYSGWITCIESEKLICIDDQMYEKLCKSTEGFTKWAATGTASFDHVGRHLIENGQLEEYRIEWIESGKICKLDVTFSGIYNGSSARKNLRANVFSYILNDQGKLLAHDTSSL